MNYEFKTERKHPVGLKRVVSFDSSANSQFSILNSNLHSGFTVMEFMIAVSIIIIISGGSVIYGAQAYRSELMAGEKSVALGVLRRARALAMSGRDGLSHGVKITSQKYIVFSGSSYATSSTETREEYLRNAGITAIGTDEFVFALGTGRSATGTLVLSSPNASSSIVVESIGRITW